MDAERLDAIARRCAGGVGSRRRVIGWAGSALMGALTAAPEAAASGKARRRCRKKGGVYLPRGKCHCGQTCASATLCGDHDGCVCRASAEARGFCAGLQAPSQGCSATSECQPGFTCTVEFACAGTGQPCAAGAECHAINPTLGCIDGACQLTFCSNPCG